MDDNLAYLFAAFSVIWVGLFAYVLVLFRQQKRIRQDIEQLKETLKKGE